MKAFYTISNHSQEMLFPRFGVIFNKKDGETGNAWEQLRCEQGTRRRVGQNFY